MNMLKYDSECVSSSTNGCIMESDKKIRNELLLANLPVSTSLSHYLLLFAVSPPLTDLHAFSNRSCIRYKPIKENGSVAIMVKTYL